MARFAEKNVVTNCFTDFLFEYVYSSLFLWGAGQFLLSCLFIVQTPTDFEKMASVGLLVICVVTKH